MLDNGSSPTNEYIGNLEHPFATSISVQHLPNGAHQIQRLDDGTIEVTDTQSKQDYYRSLRRAVDSRLDYGTLKSPTSMKSLDPAHGGTLKQALGIRKTSLGDYKPSGKEETCYVLMLEGVEKSFTIDRNAHGAHLFEKVCKEIDLRETEYFGITYRSSPRVDTWLKMGKRLSKQLDKQPWKFEFHVRYYPPNVDEFKDDLTRYCLCLQLRQDIISGLLPCSFQTYVILGAYAVQSEAGDYDPEAHANGTDYIASMPFAPHAQQSPNMLQRIAELHRLHKGQTPVQADRGFLENARRLALYGVEFHRATAASGESVSIGINHSGILIYRGRLRIAHFKWHQLVKLMYKSKTFTITARAPPIEPPINPTTTARNAGAARRKFSGQDNDDFKDVRTLNFQCVDSRAAKRLWESCTNQHAFFRLREPPETQRPNLTTAFNTRKYHYTERKPDLNSGSSSLDWNHRTQPQIQRVPTRRKPANYESAWGPPGAGPAPVVASEDPDQFYLLPGSPPPVPAEAANIELVHRLQPPAYRQPGAKRTPLAQEFWQMSPADCTQGLGMNADGTDVAALPDTGWQGCRANRGITSPGAYFYEVAMLEEGQVRLGWSTNGGSLVLGSDEHGIAYGTTDSPGATSGRLVYNGVEQPYAVNVVPGDVVGCYLEVPPDGEAVRVKWSYNGQIVEPPKTSTPLKLNGREAIFPVASLKDARVCFNFGYKPFNFPPKEVASSGLPWVPVAYVPEQNRLANCNVGWRLNPGDMTSPTNLVVSSNGRMVQAVANTGWQGFRANKGVRTEGKYYYEVEVIEDSGLARVGWSLAGGNLNLGLDSLGYGFGADRDGFGITGRQGKKLHADVIENYGEAFGKDDVIGSFINLDTGLIQWSKNGKNYGPAYHFDTSVINQGEPIYPAACLVDTTLELNYGDLPFKFPPDGDWIPLFAAPDEFITESPNWPKHCTVERKESNLVVQHRRIECPRERPEPPIRVSSYNSPEPLNEAPNGTDKFLFNFPATRYLRNGTTEPEAEPLPADSLQEDEVHNYTDDSSGPDDETPLPGNQEAHFQQPPPLSQHKSRSSSFTRAVTNRLDAEASHPDENEDDLALHQAILEVTQMNKDITVLTDSVGMLDSSSKGKKADSSNYSAAHIRH